MTYCVAMRLEEGLVFVSDSRTNAGVDHIATFRKLHRFAVAGERIIILQTAGNLATSQAVISRLQHQIQVEAEKNINNLGTLFEVAELVGECLCKVVSHVTGLCQGNEYDFSSSVLMGGQIKGQAPELYNIYPQGNFIAATVDTPYFQIGESKYGKPILDRALNYHTSIDKALRCALISFDSTIRSNVSVGTPLDLIVYRANEFNVPEGRRLYDTDPYFSLIRQQWSDGLRNTLSSLPPPPDDYWR